MGEDKLPLAVEFALKCMRIGEVADVAAPAAYGVRASPLCGRRLRQRPGFLPRMAKVARKLRFLPAAPREIFNQAKAAEKEAKAEDKAKAEAEATVKATAMSSGDDVAAAEPSAPSPGRPPRLFRARVELLGVDPVHMLTEDRLVSKRILLRGPSLRTPRNGDLVTFFLAQLQPEGNEDEGEGVMSGAAEERQLTLVLGDAELPYSGLEHVLLSMREGERCVAKLGGRPLEPRICNGSVTAEEPAPVAEVRLRLFLQRCRRRDAISVPMAGAPIPGLRDKVTNPVLGKFELRPGPYRLNHEIGDGSMVLVAFAGGSAGSISTEANPRTLLSWRVGEGTVPSYLEAVVASMRLAESSAFDVPAEALAAALLGPHYEGRTPLRRVTLPALEPLVATLLGADAGAGEEDEEPLPECAVTSDWMSAGVSVAWEDIESEQLAPGLAGSTSFRLALVAASEAPDVCMLDDEEQRTYLERERGHGNALARLGRFAEATAAYNKALDAVRRTPLYKRLFPTENGRLQCTYTRDAVEMQADGAEKLDMADLEAYKASFVALHLNLSFCAAKAGQNAEARRHASAVLGADPDNPKAFFRRGSAAFAHGDYEEASKDLKRAAELQPEDRRVREELQSLQRHIKEHRQTEKNMYQSVFKSESRKETSGAEG